MSRVSGTNRADQYETSRDIENWLGTKDVRPQQVKKDVSYEQGIRNFTSCEHCSAEPVSGPAET